MNLKDQVVNLELSKKLKELGVKQDSIFYWTIKNFVDEDIPYKCQISYKDTDIHILDDDKYFTYEYSCVMANSGFNCDEIYSAFTASEVLEMLSNHIRHEKSKWLLPLEIHKESENQFTIIYSERTWGIGELIISDTTLSNSLGKILIYLIEKNIIKVEDLK